MIHGFDPIEQPDARVLILGTIPSERSLSAGEYYAHPQNCFWRIMLALLDEGGALDYSARAELLKRSGVAVWDVLHAVERPGSLDSSIEVATAVPNDIAGFLDAHPDVRTIVFNGATAEKLFRRCIMPTLGERAVELVRLPSTSPAHAALSFSAKLEAWRVVTTAARAQTRASGGATGNGSS